MTVVELRDALDKYIKKDPPDMWQLNDVEADAKAYDARCKDRECHDVIIVIDSGLQSHRYGIVSAYGTTIYRSNANGMSEKNAFAICADASSAVN